MTNEERRERRYQRRKAKREANRQARTLSVGGIEDVFTYNKMYNYGKKCCKGVRWKCSTQLFELHIFSITAKNRRKVLEQKYKWHRYCHFRLNERGKVRPIDAPHIQDRQIHKTLTNEVLLPLYQPRMIYNNGASQRGKGYEFAQRQLLKDLHEHYRKYGRKGVAILIDFKQFFPSASHDVLRQVHRDLIENKQLRRLADSIIDTVPSTLGMPLGVEPSQAEMIHLPSDLDNYMTCQMGLTEYSHYMDDYCILLEDAEKAPEVIDKFIELAHNSKLTVGVNKTKVVNLTKPFKFCKATYRLTETGKVIVNGSRDSMKRTRRKLIFFHNNPKFTPDDIWNSVQSSITYFGKYNDHKRLLKIYRLVYALFGWHCSSINDFRGARE